MSNQLLVHIRVHLKNGNTLSIANVALQGDAIEDAPISDEIAEFEILQASLLGKTIAYVSENGGAMSVLKEEVIAIEIVPMLDRGKQNE